MHACPMYTNQHTHHPTTTLPMSTIYTWIPTYLHSLSLNETRNAYRSSSFSISPLELVERESHFTVSDSFRLFCHYFNFNLKLLTFSPLPLFITRSAPCYLPTHHFLPFHSIGIPFTHYHSLLMRWSDWLTDWLVAILLFEVKHTVMSTTTKQDIIQCVR